MEHLTRAWTLTLLKQWERGLFLLVFLPHMGGFCFVFRGGGLTPFRKIACGQWELHGTQTQSFSMCMKQWLWIQAVYTMASTAHVWLDSYSSFIAGLPDVKHTAVHRVWYSLFGAYGIKKCTLSEPSIIRLMIDLLFRKATRLWVCTGAVLNTPGLQVNCKKAA